MSLWWFWATSTLNHHKPTCSLCHQPSIHCAPLIHTTVRFKASLKLESSIRTEHKVVNILLPYLACQSSFLSANFCSIAWLQWQLPKWNVKRIDFAQWVYIAQLLVYTTTSAASRTNVLLLEPILHVFGVAAVTTDHTKTRHAYYLLVWDVRERIRGEKKNVSIRTSNRHVAYRAIESDNFTWMTVTSS